MATTARRLLAAALALLPLLPVAAQQLAERYNAERPVVVVGDWDKPPYEFQNDHGQPAGTNIDVLQAVMKQMGLPVRFELKEWGNAIKTFERGDADLILANVRRYQSAPYVATQNIINYNRIRAASLADTVGVVSMARLLQEGVVLKPSDYTTNFFRDLDSADVSRVEFQSPKVALTGLVSGDNKFFVWGEEPLKWKIKELNIEGIVLNDVSIPVSEIHIIGRDRELIYEIDDQYSRLKQSGEVERINDRWMHPERLSSDNASPTPYVLLLAVLLMGVFYFVYRLASAQVKRDTRLSADLNNMMLKALHMGNFHVMQYDIATDHMTNRYGQILPGQGMTLDEFVSHIHPDGQQEFREKMSLLVSGRQRKFDLKKRWNAGTPDSPVWLNLHGHAILELDASGRPAYVVNAVHDVTQDIEDKQANYELGRKYERLFNMPFIAMSVYDRDGWLADLNGAMKDLCGYGNSDCERFWQTMCMFDVPLFRNAYTPDDRNDLLVCQHMDYPELGISRFIEFHIHPITNSDGELTNYFISTLDISDERAHDRLMHQLDKQMQTAHQQINQYQEKLRYILEHGDMYAWRLDFRQQTIIYTRTLSKPEYVKTFQQYYDSVSDEHKAEALRGLQSPQDWDHPFSLDRHFRQPLLGDGEGPRWYNITGIPIHDAEGRVACTFGLLTDITAKHRAQQLLREETERAENSGRQKSAFLASMTHELRTPLNSIVGFSDLLNTVDTPAERREFIRIIRNNCDMLLRLINDILEASSIDDGPQSIDPADVDFAHAFDEICQSLAGRVENPAVSFLTSNPYPTLPTRLDMGRIQQVITNFVTNAVKYTHEGHVRVGYRAEHGGLLIYCEDTGTGIPKAQQATIFERFVKLNEFVQGTGLGLAICKSIAERCGGRIGVDSEGEGHGSTFWIWVPCPLPPQVATGTAD